MNRHQPTLHFGIGGKWRKVENWKPRVTWQIRAAAFGLGMRHPELSENTPKTDKNGLKRHHFSYILIHYPCTPLRSDQPGAWSHVGGARSWCFTSVVYKFTERSPICASFVTTNRFSLNSCFNQQCLHFQALQPMESAAVFVDEAIFVPSIPQRL